MLKDSKPAHRFTTICPLPSKSTRGSIFIHICIFVCRSRIYRILRSDNSFLFFRLKHVPNLRSNICEFRATTSRRRVIFNWYDFNITLDILLLRRVPLSYILISLPWRWNIFIILIWRVVGIFILHYFLFKSVLKGWNFPYGNSVHFERPRFIILLRINS